MSKIQGFLETTRTRDVLVERDASGTYRVADDLGPPKRSAGLSGQALAGTLRPSSLSPKKSHGRHTMSQQFLRPAEEKIEVQRLVDNTQSI